MTSTSTVRRTTARVLGWTAAVLGVLVMHGLTAGAADTTTDVRRSTTVTAMGDMPSSHASAHQHDHDGAPHEDAGTCDLLACLCLAMLTAWGLAGLLRGRGGAGRLLRRRTPALRWALITREPRPPDPSMLAVCRC